MTDSEDSPVVATKRKRLGGARRQLRTMDGIYTYLNSSVQGSDSSGRKVKRLKRSGTAQNQKTESSASTDVAATRRRVKRTQSFLSDNEDDDKEEDSTRSGQATPLPETATEPPARSAPVTTESSDPPCKGGKKTRKKEGRNRAKAAPKDSSVQGWEALAKMSNSAAPQPPETDIDHYFPRKPKNKEDAKPKKKQKKKEKKEKKKEKKEKKKEKDPPSGSDADGFVVSEKDDSSQSSREDLDWSTDDDDDRGGDRSPIYAQEEGALAWDALLIASATGVQLSSEQFERERQNEVKKKHEELKRQRQENRTKKRKKTKENNAPSEQTADVDVEGSLFADVDDAKDDSGGSPLSPERLGGEESDNHVSGLDDDDEEEARDLEAAQQLAAADLQREMAKFDAETLRAQKLEKHHKQYEEEKQLKLEQMEKEREKESEFARQHRESQRKQTTFAMLRFACPVFPLWTQPDEMTLYHIPFINLPIVPSNPKASMEVRRHHAFKQFTSYGRSHELSQRWCESQGLLSKEGLDQLRCREALEEFYAEAIAEMDRITSVTASDREEVLKLVSKHHNMKSYYDQLQHSADTLVRRRIPESSQRSSGECSQFVSEASPEQTPEQRVSTVETTAGEYGQEVPDEDEGDTAASVTSADTWQVMDNDKAPDQPQNGAGSTHEPDETLPLPPSSADEEPACVCIDPPADQKSSSPEPSRYDKSPIAHPVATAKDQSADKCPLTPEAPRITLEEKMDEQAGIAGNYVSNPPQRPFESRSCDHPIPSKHPIEQADVRSLQQKSVDELPERFRQTNTIRKKAQPNLMKFLSKAKAKKTQLPIETPAELPTSPPPLSTEPTVPAMNDSSDEEDGLLARKPPKRAPPTTVLEENKVSPSREENREQVGSRDDLIAEGPMEESPLIRRGIAALDSSQSSSEDDEASLTAEDIDEIRRRQTEEKRKKKAWEKEWGFVDEAEESDGEGEDRPNKPEKSEKDKPKGDDHEDSDSSDEEMEEELQEFIAMDKPQADSEATRMEIQDLVSRQLLEAEEKAYKSTFTMEGLRDRHQRRREARNPMGEEERETIRQQRRREGADHFDSDEYSDFSFTTDDDSTSESGSSEEEAEVDATAMSTENPEVVERAIRQIKKRKKERRRKKEQKRHFNHGKIPEIPAKPVIELGKEAALTAAAEFRQQTARADVLQSMFMSSGSSVDAVSAGRKGFWSGLNEGGPQASQDSATTLHSQEKETTATGDNGNPLTGVDSDDDDGVDALACFLR